MTDIRRNRKHNRNKKWLDEHERKNKEELENLYRCKKQLEKLKEKYK